MKFIKTTDNSFVINWDLGRRCTYSCSYCPPFRSNKHSKVVSIDQMLHTFEFIHEYVNIYESAKKLPYNRSLSITGGEPTIHPDFFKFAEYVSSEYGDHYDFNLTTNGAFSRNIAKKILDMNLGGTISYHPEASNNNKKLVMNNILLLGSSQKFKINVMFHKDYFDECIEICEKLKSNGIKFIPRRIGEEGGSNREESIRNKWVQEYDEKQEKWFSDYYKVKDTTFGRSCCGGRCLITEKGNQNFISDTNFNGWSCTINWNFLFINQETRGIWTHQTCGVNTESKVGPIGYLDEAKDILDNLKNKLHSEKMPIIKCPKTHCLCGMCILKSDNYKFVENEMKNKTKIENFIESDLNNIDRSEWVTATTIINGWLKKNNNI